MRKMKKTYKEVVSIKDTETKKNDPKNPLHIKKIDHKYDQQTNLKKKKDRNFSQQRKKNNKMNEYMVTTTTIIIIIIITERIKQAS